MRVTRFDDPAVFAAEANPFLFNDEARNNFFLGVVAQLKNPTDSLLLTINDSSTVLGVGVMTRRNMTPARHLVLSDNLPTPAVDALIDELAHESISVPGIQTTPAQAEHFAHRWCSLVNAETREQMRLALFRLDKVIPPPRADGILRQATWRDLDLVTGWIDAFVGDIGESLAGCRELADTVIARQRLFLWENRGTPLSMAAWTRLTPNGCAINFVYTPQHLRGRGLASNCVAALSQHMLDTGKKFCTLYTDLANPTSNKIYQRIGYRQISLAAKYAFSPKELSST
ncbi:MAG TPA: GNAT family N-acetyltransferase [Tepidisphaeraceae bacterium]